ncbi:MAG TPA: BON domain-containing protein [Aquabacterium sp.]|mgnify:CR=1 FL=1|nr:BON domain-containing protein [Aquabacterium sp.]HQC97775.1 BON domain-containing protein [Aquabacterium sp.]
MTEFHRRPVDDTPHAVHPPLVEPVAPAVAPATTVIHHTTEYRPRRRIWPGVLGAGLIGALVAALVVSNAYDNRSIGQKVDAGIAATRQGLSAAAEQGAQVTQRATEGAAAVLDDAGITAAVKTALAADPALSALKIGVDTSDGVVRLTGPAPDAQARDRAGVLAAAPKGVRSVDNLLKVEPAGNG